MSEIQLGGPSSKSINVLVAIDAEALKKSGLAPGQSESSPTMINDPTLLSNVFFMICTGSRGVLSGQGTDKLNFKANAGDFVSFEGITVDGNSDDAVIIYGIDEKANQVFNEFRSMQVTRTKAVQAASTKNGLPQKSTGAESHSPCHVDSLLRVSCVNLPTVLPCCGP